jgi:DNA-directed RNA polymerase III subunit RPC1
MCVNDGFVLIRNSELLCGPLDKKTVGGAKNTIFYHLLREYGQEAAADRMSRLARLCARYLGAWSLGIIRSRNPAVSSFGGFFFDFRLMRELKA